MSEIKEAAPVRRTLGVVEPGVEFTVDVDRILADPSIPAIVVTPVRGEPSD
jgi:hypothetical protein